ncbi:M48 family metallopeptidase [Massilia sp. DWR3-1-1]|uniref:M48 family metallopeptidase n=1 Tax=Massilia sp. DWR3-1-1 TaxID=2804559 RepID=UPI003CED9656
MSNAQYFDGVSARLHQVELSTADGHLHLAGPGIDWRGRLDQVRLAEPFLDAPSVLYLPGGARCEVADPQARAAVAAALAYRPGLVVRWQRHWYAALAALVLLLAVGAAVWVWVLPAAAEKIAANVPDAFDGRLGASALAGLEAKVFAPSTLSQAQVAALQAMLAEVAPASPRHRLRLLNRSAPALGPNALALPDGTIIITDQLVLAVLGKQTTFDDEMRAGLMGVLAHEVGHVQRRHSVRALARSSLTAAASAALLGDFSAVAAGIPAVLANLHYSRAMETEADLYAVDTLHRKGISTQPLAKLLDWLEESERKSIEHNLPAWMKQALPYAASHPGAYERSRRMIEAEQAAEKK